MIYREEVGNLFTAPEGSYLAHCISADFAMGKGIATEFVQRYDEKAILMKRYPEFLAIYRKLCGKGQYGTCIVDGRICNLVTKERYWQKPTLQSLKDALLILKKKVPRDASIAMPMIGAGLDRLPWEKVREILQEVFQDTDVQITVYALSREKFGPSQDTEQQMERI